MNHPGLALRRPVTMAMIVVALLVMGVISYQSLPVQELPNVSFPFVVVSINYPGASPEDMEQLVTQPVENAVSGVSGIQQINGFAGSGTSRVSMQFANGTDVGVAANDVAQVVNRVQRSLPAGISTPSILNGNIRPDAYFQRAAELNKLVVRSRQGNVPVTLDQIATVQQGYARVPQPTHLNGKDAVVLEITAQSGANIVQVDDAAKAQLAKL